MKQSVKSHQFLGTVIICLGLHIVLAFQGCSPSAKAHQPAKQNLPEPKSEQKQNSQIESNKIDVQEVATSTEIPSSN